MARENSRTATAIAVLVKNAGKPMAAVVSKLQDALEKIDAKTGREDIARNYYNWILRQKFPEVIAAEKAHGAFERSARGGRTASADAPKVKATVKSAAAKAPAKKAAPAKKSAPSKRKAGTKTTRAGAKKGGRDVSALKAKLTKKAG